MEEVKKVKKSQYLKGVDGNNDLVKLLEEAAYFIEEGVNLDELTHFGGTWRCIVIHIMQLFGIKEETVFVPWV